MNYFNNGQLYNQPANNGYATEIVRITGIILTNMVSNQYISQQVAQVVYNNISNNINVIAQDIIANYPQCTTQEALAQVLQERYLNVYIAQVNNMFQAQQNNMLGAGNWGNMGGGFGGGSGWRTTGMGSGFQQPVNNGGWNAGIPQYRTDPVTTSAPPSANVRQVATPYINQDDKSEPIVNKCYTPQRESVKPQEPEKQEPVSVLEEKRTVNLTPRKNPSYIPGIDAPPKCTIKESTSSIKFDKDKVSTDPYDKSTKATWKVIDAIDMSKDNGSTNVDYAILETNLAFPNDKAAIDAAAQVAPSSREFTLRYIKYGRVDVINLNAKFMKQTIDYVVNAIKSADCTESTCGYISVIDAALENSVKKYADKFIQLICDNFVVYSKSGFLSSTNDYIYINHIDGLEDIIELMVPSNVKYKDLYRAKGYDELTRTLPQRLLSNYFLSLRMLDCENPEDASAISKVIIANQIDEVVDGDYKLSDIGILSKFIADAQDEKKQELINIRQQIIKRLEDMSFLVVPSWTGYNNNRNECTHDSPRNNMGTFSSVFPLNSLDEVNDIFFRSIKRFLTTIAPEETTPVLMHYEGHENITYRIGRTTDNGAYCKWTKSERETQD